MKSLIALVLGILIITGCKTSYSPESNTQDQLNSLYERYKAFYHYIYPEDATYNGINDYNDKLMDMSFEAGERYTDSIVSFKLAIEAIDKKELNPDEQINYDLFEHEMNRLIKEDSYEIGRYLQFTQQNGYHIYFPQIVEVQPLENSEDVKNYFSRLKAFPHEVNNIIETLRKAKMLDIMLPCPISEQVLSQLEGFASMQTEDSPFFLATEKSDALKAEANELRDILKNMVAPAYQKLFVYFRDQYQPFCRKKVGISSVPGGKEYYEYLTKMHTSTDLSPDEIFKTGMSEVARIKAIMVQTKDALGYDELELQAFFDHLRTSPEFYFTEKQDLLTGYRKILDNMDAKLPGLFGKLPQTGYDLKEMEAYRAEAAPAAYYYPSPSNGSRPGYFYINTYQLDSRPTFTMTALALHEAVPGHHLQFALASELENVPWFRTKLRVTAYEEGWGLYSEYLGYESGMYDDPLQKIGALSFEMWRACRLVVDVGIHYKGWSREEALAFLKENAPLSELDMNSEIDRYISWPGQALAYKIGEIRIKELRARAERELQQKFDIKAFHDVVLEYGSIPLDLLESNVNTWIESLN